jgi:AraC-like DNA-binding protein
MTGSTIWEYIIAKRLILAKGMLKNGEPPTMVYTKCGFTDYGTFFRNYTSYFGFSPSQREEIAERRIMI